MDEHGRWMTNDISINYIGRKSLGVELRSPVSSYLSDDQRAILGGRDGLVALRVLNQHGLSGLRLPVTQPPAEAVKISDVRNQTSVNSHAEKPCNTDRSDSISS